MPAKLIAPIEIIKKEAVLVDEFDTTQIFINLKGSPYIRITYDLKDASGNIIGTSEVTLDSVETAQFIQDNPTTYSAIKEASYKVGKIKNVIPSDAGVI